MAGAVRIFATGSATLKAAHLASALGMAHAPAGGAGATVAARSTGMSLTVTVATTRLADTPQTRARAAVVVTVALRAFPGEALLAVRVTRAIRVGAAMDAGVRNARAFTAVRMGFTLDAIAGVTVERPAVAIVPAGRAVAGVADAPPAVASVGSSDAAVDSTERALGVDGRRLTFRHAVALATKLVRTATRVIGEVAGRWLASRATGSTRGASRAATRTASASRAATSGGSTRRGSTRRGFVPSAPAARHLCLGATGSAGGTSSAGGTGSADAATSSDRRRGDAEYVVCVAARRHGNESRHDEEAREFAHLTSGRPASKGRPIGVNGHPGPAKRGISTRELPVGTKAVEVTSFRGRPRRSVDAVAAQETTEAREAEGFRGAENRRRASPFASRRIFRRNVG